MALTQGKKKKTFQSYQFWGLKRQGEVKQVLKFNKSKIPSETQPVFAPLT